MPKRYLYALLLLVAAALLVPSLLEDRGQTPASPPGPRPDVPEAALEAMRQGRYWRASRVLREYLAARTDTSAAAALVAARAEAGWGDWRAVESLLEGKPWLDTASAGLGWSLLGQGRMARQDWTGAADALARYLEVAGPGGRERGLAHARRALALARAERAQEALQAYDAAARDLPRLADWLELLAAEAAAHAGDTAEVRQRLAGTDSVLARERAWRIHADALRDAGDRAGALAAAERAAASLSGDAGRAAAWALAGELRLEAGDTAGARAALRRAMDTAPSGAAALGAARTLSGLSGGAPDERLAIGRLYLRHGELDRAVAALDAYLDAGRGSAAVRTAIRLDIARALFRAGRYRAAEQRLLALTRSADPRTAAEALFTAGRAQYRQGRESEGRATFARVAEQFPGQPAAAEALYLLADLDHDDMRLDRARDLYRRTIEARPDAEEAGLAYMRLAGLAYVEKDLAEAARIYEEYRGRYPEGRRYHQATYWAGKAYRALGRDSLAQARLREALRIDPLAYYAGRAADLLGTREFDLPLAPAPETTPEAERALAGPIARIDLLRELDLDDEAAFEIERLKATTPRAGAARYALAEALLARGYAYSGIRLGWDIKRGEERWNPRLLRIVYPLPYRGLILAEAEERGLDPFFVAALIRQESMFNAGVASHAGAIGLMQVMPPTGEALARQARVSPFDPQRMLRKPEINIHLGTLFLDDLLERYDRRPAPVLAAYNAGPHRVTRWSRFPEFADEDLFAERIPYAETRDYVKIVQNNQRIYRALYGPEAVGASDE